MRGGYLHNRLLVAPLKEAIESYGAFTRTEFYVSLDEGSGFVDLVVVCEDRVIAIEAELTPNRVPGDLAKARRCGADELWIVVPNRRVARSVRRRLSECVRRQIRPEVFVLTLGAALQRVTSCFSLNSASFLSENNPENNHHAVTGVAKGIES